MKSKFTFKELSNVIIGYADINSRGRELIVNINWSTTTIYPKDRYRKRKSTREHITFGTLAKIIKTIPFNGHQTLRIHKEVLYKYQELMLMLDEQYLQKIAKRLTKAVWGNKYENIFNSQPGYLAVKYHSTKRYYTEKAAFRKE